MFLIAIRDAGLTLWASAPNEVGAFLQQEPKLKTRMVPDSHVLLLEPTQTMHHLVEKYGQDSSLFSMENELTKKALIGPSQGDRRTRV